MTENEIGEIVVDCAVKVHMRLGPGLLESVYETVLCYEFHNRGRSIQRRVAVPITYSVSPRLRVRIPPRRDEQRDIFGPVQKKEAFSAEKGEV